MSLHRYPADALAGDYLRGGSGLAMTGLPLLALNLHWSVAGLFGGLALLFAVFLARTAERHATVIETSAAGIAARGPRGQAIAWGELADLRLRYFSTRRDRQGGWMHLVLQGGGRTLALESTLSGFDAVVEAAAAAARQNGVAVSPATRDNLLALGIDVPKAEEA